MTEFQVNIGKFFEHNGFNPEKPTLKQIYEAFSFAAMKELKAGWQSPSLKEKRVCYFSAEFLIGRVIHSNLYNLGLLEKTDELLKKYGLSIAAFEDIDDAAFGNGGLGRLAACFLDSAATKGIHLDGYGIRYQYGLFKQSFEKGFQKEKADDWEQFGDPWSVRREEDTVIVNYRGQSVKAVPYDMPVIGYGGTMVNFLRLWKSEPVNGFDFDLFNRQKYDEAVSEKNRAEEICAVLYPNDNTRDGKILRLKQEYFFSSASLQDIVRRYTSEYGDDFSHFADCFAVQLNDTHPAISIPELLRILMGEYLLAFEDAFDIVKSTFAYTNHTIMPEALEKWDLEIFYDVLPEVYPYVVMISNSLKKELAVKNISSGSREDYQIISGGLIHMAWLSIYGSHSTNGVSALHTMLLKTDLLKNWVQLYPGRVNNKTNGVTPRRWLGLCNPEYSEFISERIGSGWITDLNLLHKLKPFAEDEKTLAEFMRIKREKKVQLAEYVKKHENFDLNPDLMFFSLCKRLHEYKRQLLDAFSLMDIYFGLKEGRIKDFTPAAFIYGAKSAPGYDRAKGIIKYVNEVAKLIHSDPDMKDLIQVMFVQNYNVSYAEKIIPATEVSVQISTAGTEASGTSNMKMSLNGAVTLGTRDGANIEIVEQAGEENNYMFGATIEQIKQISDSYNPLDIYHSSPRVKRVLDTLVDGTFSDGGGGIFKELYDSILHGANWHKPDHYYLLQDFESYVDAKLKVNHDYKNRLEFSKKGLLNTAGAGNFSSDNTILAYAREIWGL